MKTIDISGSSSKKSAEKNHTRRLLDDGVRWDIYWCEDTSAQHTKTTRQKDPSGETAEQKGAGGCSSHPRSDKCPRRLAARAERGFFSPGKAATASRQCISSLHTHIYIYIYIGEEEKRESYTRLIWGGMRRFSFFPLRRFVSFRLKGKTWSCFLHFIYICSTTFQRRILEVLRGSLHK
jgi:hypothetical protein